MLLTGFPAVVEESGISCRSRQPSQLFTCCHRQHLQSDGFHRRQQEWRRIRLQSQQGIVSVVNQSTRRARTSAEKFDDLFLVVALKQTLKLPKQCLPPPRSPQHWTLALPRGALSTWWGALKLSSVNPPHFFSALGVHESSSNQSNQVQERIKFKVSCLVRQSLSGHAPVYLADDCCLVTDSTRPSRRSLWSADVPTCVVPRTFSSYGDRTFAAAGPRLWNSLPVQLRNPDITYGLFRRHLQGHLFGEA